MIEPGKFDSLLFWPFLKWVRLSLIYQNPCKDNRDDITYVLDFEERRERITKPMKDDRFDSGIDIRHEVLRTRSYIMNNTICIIVSKEN